MTQESPTTRRASRPRSLVAGLLLAGVCSVALMSIGSADDGGEEEDEWTRQRPEFEAIARNLREGQSKLLGSHKVEQLRSRLSAPDLTPPKRVDLLNKLSWHLLRLGQVEQAVALCDQALELSTERPLGKALRARTLFARGLAYLRLAEVQNCVVRHNADCCILPLAGGGRHSEDGPARVARESYEAYLALQPGEGRAAWVLNVLAMALGDHPQAVPPRYRVPLEAFASDHDLGRFRDVAPALGVDTFNQCGGVAIEDFDGDGRLDIVTSTFDPEGPLTFYRNLGPKGFEDASQASRLDDQLGGLNLVAADHDGDGDVDLLVLRGAWLQADGEIRNSLLENDGQGRFTDVTRAAGLAQPAAPTQAACWGDLDLDGDLDLFVVNESPAGSLERYPAQLFRNDGDGTYTDVAREAGVAECGFAKGVTAGDYDNDGDLDLYVSNIGPNRLFRNEGGLRFVDVAPDLGLTSPVGRSFATWFFDYDNDGWLDLFVTAFQASVVDVTKDLMGAPLESAPPCLYRNRGDGSFEDVTAKLGLDHAWLPMGANFGDLDNDGWLDMYLSTGEPSYLTLVPNVMLRNDGARGFQDITTSAGMGHLQKGHGVAFADLDDDGDQDLYHQLGGFYPGDKFRNALFANHGHGNHFMSLRLAGAGKNRMGLGARVRVVLETPDGERELHRTVGSVSSFGGSPYRQEIGLGDAVAVKLLEVRWPGTDQPQRFEDVPLDAHLVAVQGQDALKRLEPTAHDISAAQD